MVLKVNDVGSFSASLNQLVNSSSMYDSSSMRDEFAASTKSWKPTEGSPRLASCRSNSSSDLPAMPRPMSATVVRPALRTIAANLPTQPSSAQVSRKCSESWAYFGESRVVLVR
jgi:hypothetical protein